MASEYYDKAVSLQQQRIAQTHDMLAQRRELRSHLALRTGERVLDVGSGNGILASELLSDVGRTGKVVGVDPAEPMIEMSRQFCPEAVFLQGDAVALPVDSGEFDAVTASQVLCFVADVDAALAEMFRVLRPGGRLVILDTDWDTLLWNCNDQALLQRVVAELTRPYTSAHLPRTLSRQLQGVGFDVTDRRAYPVVNWGLDEPSYSAQIAAFLSAESNDPEVQALGSAWTAELSGVAARGEYLFSLNRYIFCARKP